VVRGREVERIEVFDCDPARPALFDAECARLAVHFPAGSIRRIAQHWAPLTFDHCDHVTGPFYHGTKSALSPGDELTPGFGSNFQGGRVSNNIYFSTLVGTAAWGAQLATALSGGEGRGYIYVVEPLGPFEDDPNVTNKRFPGNPTRSYRTREPLRVVRELEEWQEHSAEELEAMLRHLAHLREQGLDVIED
jgi:rifampin ADP-ribosylating transferase